MASRDYEYECMRAELLGLEKPDRAEFEQDREQVESEILTYEGEQLGRVTGGLDELNAVIDSTRHKLTHYQSFHKKLGKLFHHKSKTPHRSDTSITCNSEENLHLRAGPPKQTAGATGSQMSQSSLNFEEYERQNDKLDALLSKAERAELSLNRNNKLIKKLLKK